MLAPLLVAIIMGSMIFVAIDIHCYMECDSVNANDIVIFVFCILPFIIAALNILYLFTSRSKRKNRKEIYEHYELSNKLSAKGTYTSNLSVAKDCYERLQSSYSGIKSSVSGVSRDCFEEDIAYIRDNMETIIEGKWDTKARKYLNTISELYWLIRDSDFETIDTACKSKKKFFDTYDKYWAWTDECHQELDHWSSINLWDTAKKDMQSTLDGSGITFWNDPGFGRYSVRQQLDKQLTEKIETMRPEYRRKMKLYDLLVNYVYDNPGVARSALLKIALDGYSSQEIAACYRSLISKQRLIAVKIGNRYFVSLTDKETEKQSKRHQPKEAKEPPATAQES